MTTTPLPVFIEGFRIIASTMMVDHLPLGRPVRYHRKARIQKKWLKRYGRRFIEVPKPDLLQINKDTLVGHPDTIERVKREIEKIGVGG
jgi:hypothetical protein